VFNEIHTKQYGGLYGRFGILEFAGLHKKIQNYTLEFFEKMKKTGFYAIICLQNERIALSRGVVSISVWEI